MVDIKVVVSKYKEDVNWIHKSIYPTIIYDKSNNPIERSIHRPNIGREAETLLYYIISNYDKLPSGTIFLQGDPRFNPVRYTYEEIINKINSTHALTGLTSFLEPLWYIDDISGYWEKTSGRIYNILFDTNKKSVTYSSGVEYILPRDNILNRPLEFYQHIYKSLLQFGNKPLQCFEKEDLKQLGISAWAIEPLWGCIFDKTLKLKNNYKEFL